LAFQIGAGGQLLLRPCENGVQLDSTVVSTLIQTKGFQKEGANRGSWSARRSP
jgi:hypothetical protein